MFLPISTPPPAIRLKSNTFPTQLFFVEPLSVGRLLGRLALAVRLDTGRTR